MQLLYVGLAAGLSPGGMLGLGRRSAAAKLGGGLMRGCAVGFSGVLFGMKVQKICGLLFFYCRWCFFVGLHAAWPWAAGASRPGAGGRGRAVAAGKALGRHGALAPQPACNRRVLLAARLALPP